MPPTATVVPATPTSLPTPATTTPAEGTITGTISYPGETLPSNAVLTVRLLQVGGFGASNAAEPQTIQPTPSGPMSFAISYDPTQIDPAIDYALEAQMTIDGLVLYEHKQVAVLTKGAPSTAEITLAPPTDRLLVSGTISYPQPDALPADAVLTISMFGPEEGSLYRIGERIIKLTKAGTITFGVQSEPMFGPLDRQARVYASLRAGGKLLAVTNEIASVQTQNGMATLDLQLAPPAQLGTVSGTVSYPAQEALSADAVLTVQLLDASMADGPAPLLGEQTFAQVGPGPIPYSIEYDKALTQPGGSYTVSAQVYSGERLLLSTMMRYDIQLDSSAPVDVAMEPVPVRP